MLPYRVYGEWALEGSFEDEMVRVHIQGFVAGYTLSLKFKTLNMLVNVGTTVW